MARSKKPKGAQSKGDVIVGDGKCERLYFDQMKVYEGFTSKVKPELPTDSGSWSKVFDAVDKLLENDEYDRIYCLIDYDKVIEEKKSLDSYLSRKRKFEKTKKVFIFESNPCFETWFLVHYVKTGKLFSNCDDVVNNLKKHIRDYAKGEKYYTRKAIYEYLKPQQKDAIDNAKFLELNRDDFSINYPRAEVYKLIEQLIPTNTPSV
jgi:hypothetical protein